MNRFSVRRILLASGVAIALPVFGTLLAFFGGRFIDAYSKSVEEHIFTPLGFSRVYPSFIETLIQMTVLTSPLLIIVALLFFLVMVDESAQLTKSEKFKQQISNLEGMKQNLKTSLGYISELQAEIALKSEKHEQLTQELGNLEALSKDNLEDLRKKLEGLEVVTAKKQRRKVIFGFILGVVSSLLASAIWFLITAKVVGQR